MKKKNILLSGILVTLLTACNGGGNTTNSGKKEETIGTPWWTTEGEIVKNDNGDIVFDDIHIQLTTIVAGDDLDPFRAIVGKFNEQHEGKIKVSVNYVAERSYAKEVADRIHNNSTPPDLLMTHQKFQKQLVHHKLIQPLDEVIEATGYEYDLNNYSTVLAEETNLDYKDATFTLPIDIQSEIVLYNKKILNELGKAVPTSREELLDVCKAFKEQYSYDSGYRAIALPTNCDHFPQYAYPTAYLQNGGSLYNENNYYAEWTDEKNMQAHKDATEAIVSLDRDYQYTTLSDDYATARSRFNSKKALFLVIPPWLVEGTLSTYRTQNSVTTMDDVMDNHIGGASLSGLFALDSSKDYAEDIYIDSHSFSISKSVTDKTTKAACLYFAKWFTETPSIGVDWANAGHSSASSKILNSEEYLSNKFVDEYMRKFYDINVVRTVGNNPYAAEFIESLHTLAANSVINYSKIEAVVEEQQNLYNSNVELASM